MPKHDGSGGAVFEIAGLRACQQPASGREHGGRQRQGERSVITERCVNLPDEGLLPTGRVCSAPGQVTLADAQIKTAPPLTSSDALIYVGNRTRWCLLVERLAMYSKEAPLLVSPPTLKETAQ